MSMKEAKEIINVLDSNQAFQVLRNLATKNAKFASAILKEAKEILYADVVIEEVGEDLFYALSNLTIEECYSRAGKQRDGSYCDIGDTAYEMFEVAMEDYLTQLKKYHDAAKPLLAGEYLKGILIGLYKYDLLQNKEIDDLLDDNIVDLAQYLIIKWKNHYPIDEELNKSLIKLAKES